MCKGNGTLAGILKAKEYIASTLQVTQVVWGRNPKDLFGQGIKAGLRMALLNIAHLEEAAKGIYSISNLEVEEEQEEEQEEEAFDKEMDSRIMGEREA